MTYAWAIARPDGELVAVYLCENGGDARAAYLMGNACKMEDLPPEAIERWQRIYRQGWRCVYVEILAIGSVARVWPDMEPSAN